MEHLTCAHTAGRSTPTNDETRKTPHFAGLKDYETEQRNFTQNHEVLQATDDCSTFARLSRQFEKIGLRLYPLTGSSVLVSAPSLGMSRALPDLRAATGYLCQIGGAV